MLDENCDDNEYEDDEYDDDDDDDDETSCQEAELVAALEELQTAFSEFDRLLKNYDLHEWNRWKAGGKLVSNEFISMYPDAEKCIEGLL